MGCAKNRGPCSTAPPFGSLAPELDAVVQPEDLRCDAMHNEPEPDLAVTAQPTEAYAERIKQARQEKVGAVKTQAKAIFADEDVYAGYKKRRHADDPAAA